MKIRNKKVFVNDIGEFFVTQCFEYKANQYVYVYEFPLGKNKKFSALVGASPKALGLKCAGAF
jgi:hypothetical protein